MKARTLTCYITIILICCCSSVFAEEETVSLGIITVTSPGEEQKIEDVQASVEVIDEKTIRSFSRRSLSQVLQYATGTFVMDTGSTSSVAMRGFESDHTLILVDGMRRTVKYGNNSADLNGLQLEDVERIEIVRGPMSALYGSEALGGVINIVTKRSTGERSFQTTLTGGVAETSQRDTGIISGIFDLGAVGNSRHRTSFEVKRRDEFRADKGEIYTDLKDEEKIFFTYRGDFNFSEDHWLRWDFEYHDQDDDGISSAGNVPTFEREERYHLGMNYHNTLGVGSLDVKMAYGNNDAESDRTSGVEKTDYEQWEGNAFYSFQIFDRHNIITGAGARRQEIEHTIYSDIPDRDIYHALIQDQWRLLDDVTLVAGVRFDHYNDFGDTTNPKVTLSWNPGNWKMRVGYGMAFKAPSFAELYSSFRRSSGNRVFNITGNPDLDPEESETYEAALGFRGRKFGAELVYHFSEFDNLITSESTLVPPYGPILYFDTIYKNVNEAEINGIEFTFNTTPWDFLELSGAWEYLHKLDGDTKERLVDYPQNKAKLSLSLFYDKAEFSAKYLRIMDYYSTDTSRAYVKSDYSQMDLRLAYALFEDHELFLGIDNLFNKETPDNWTRGGTRVDPGARYYYIGYTAKWF